MKLLKKNTSEQSNQGFNTGVELTGKLNFWWIESNNEHVWYLRKDNHTAPSSFTLNWEPQTFFAAGQDISSWFYWKLYAQKLVITIMESDKTNDLKPITLCTYGRQVREICEYFCFVNRLHNIQDVKKVHVESYEQYILGLKINSSSIETKLYILNLMWILNEDVGTGLNFLPYHAGTIKKISKKLGKRGKHTETIPPKEFFRILDCSISEVENSKPWLLKLDSYIQMKAKYPNKVSRAYMKRYSESSNILLKKIEVIYASAIVVLFSLTAMRKHEATVLRYDDVLYMLENDSDLVGRVHKTSKTETGKETKRPLPEEGRNALHVICELSKYTRAKDQDDERLLLRLPYKHSVSPLNNSHNYLTTNVLYKLYDNLVNHLGLDYKLRPHMLRKAFAMIWCWRYEIGDLEYLSKFLFHNSYEFTKAYIEDADTYKFLPEQTQQYTHEIFEQALSGKTIIKGAAGKLISKYQQLLAHKVQVLDANTLDIFIKKLLSKFNYQVTPNADGYCFMSDSRSSRAKCSTNGRDADYTNRSEKHCFTCQNFGVSEANVSYWERRKEAHLNVSKNTKDQLLFKAASEGVKRAESVIKMFEVQ
ncbi:MULTISPECIES: tyrosine-type recombinase/integrase [unclassified Pseudoalteromonas]|uniref:tyrosine-type recombinase/integrase n=1 Tax=unclassified Pseudoalteromonas TaxID=194690 RepID=UPI0015FC4B24|nr:MULTISPECIES: tyrosine-type recombinase/integrase [unclassified Pseudoalteromonas]MBB1304158.1 tyrosine-type recombinase/integrase [Pseudoalteromonas sp. SR43-5]QQM64668.1 tyrosine-type recombinase/integrase [Pseudoalteromonas sp. LC2018020214]